MTAYNWSFHCSFLPNFRSFRPNFLCMIWQLNDACNQLLPTLRDATRGGGIRGKCPPQHYFCLNAGNSYIRGYDYILRNNNDEKWRKNWKLKNCYKIIFTKWSAAITDIGMIFVFDQEWTGDVDMAQVPKYS